MTLEGNCGDEQTVEIPNQEQTNCVYLEDCAIPYHHQGCFINDYQDCAVYKFRKKMEEE